MRLPSKSVSFYAKMTLFRLNILEDVIYYNVPARAKTLQYKITRATTVPGSTRPRATTLSKPEGASFKEGSSLVIVYSLPSATSLRNITPVLFEVRTKICDRKKEFSTLLKALSFSKWSCICGLTVTYRLAVFRCKIDPTTDAASWLRHYPQAALQNSCNHCYICTVPQKTTVFQLVVLSKTLPLQGGTRITEAGPLLFCTTCGVRVLCGPTSISRSTSHTLTIVGL